MSKYQNTAFVNDPSRVMTTNLARHKYNANHQKKIVSMEKQKNNSTSQNKDVVNETEIDMNSRNLENESEQAKGYFQTRKRHI